MSGELVQGTTDELLAKIAHDVASGADRIVVDLSGMTYLDETGLAVCVEAWRLLQRVGGSLSAIVSPAQTTVRRRFENSALDRYLPLVDTRDQALGTLSV